MLLTSPTSQAASSGKPGRGLTLAALGALVLVTASCTAPEVILSGDRINVLPEIVIETASPDALAEGAGLPEMVNLNSARMPGFDSGHSGGNSKLQPPLSTSWSSTIGKGGTDLTELALPVVGDGRVYTVSPDGTVSAFDVKNGASIWSTVIEEKGDDPLPGIGGGLALSPEGLVVHAGGRALSLLDPASGDLIWTIEMKIPLRGGPTIIGADRVAVTDLDGNMKVHLLVSGEELWVHLGIAAGTVLFGAPAPAYANDEIALAGAGGEVTYFDAGSGELLWTDSVASLLPRTPIQNLGDVRAHPVHDGGLIFVIGQSGRIVAFSARNGLPVWERAIAGLEMPWVAGETVFVLSLDGRLYAIRRDDGVIRWVTELAGAVPLDVVVPENPPRYYGPVVAGDRVHVVSQAGTVFSFDPDSGEEVERLSLGREVRTPPQVAAGRMFVMGHNGTLVAVE
jgi:outer membrane protein assembly factor BamB